MIVQITKSGFYRHRTLDWDSEGLSQVYYTYIRFWYEFITKNGYAGRLRSPDFLIHFFKVENMVHEYLGDGSKIWVDQVDPTPYLKMEFDDEGDLVYVNRFNEKYFYKIRFKKNTWVKVDFDDIVIKQIAPSSETDPFNVNSFEIWPYNVQDIRPVLGEEEPDYLLLDEL